MVTAEIIRLFHMFIITWDRILVDAEFGGPEPHNSNMIGQLGSVTHVLTDKTGTLTENKMELVAFTDSTGSHAASAFRSSGDVSASMEFILCLAICNTVIVYHRPDGTTEYNAESPDEAAFVQFAADLGVVLIDRQPDSFSLQIRGELHEYEVVSLLPFDSDRKRMSIVVGERGSDRLTVYTKGADSIMFARVVAPLYTDEVNGYALQGLRTLIFARRTLADAAEWRSVWHAASSSIRGRDEAVAAAAARIECELAVTGLSAVEDRLQPHVPEAVQWLRDAGVAVWVLTGDKLETAIEIGRTSRVIGDASEMLIVSQERDDEIRAQLATFRSQAEGGSFTDPVLILTARAAEFVLTQDTSAFLAVAGVCKSVVFSRVSPFQKASVVALVRRLPGTGTLAIGDGANDVGMLQEADVGVGVKGREGSQAAQASDFAIPRFRQLVPLVAVHGHWTAHRLNHVCMFMMYKNFAMIAVFFWSSIDALGSPADFYEPFLLSFFNLLFTLFPPFAYGGWERDVRRRDLLAHPQLYRPRWNPMEFPFPPLYFGLAFWQAVVVYFVIRFALPDAAVQSNGNLAYICIVCVITVQFMLWATDWNGFVIGSCVLTVVLLFGVIIIYAYAIEPGLVGMVAQALGSLRGWFVFVCTIVGSALPYIAGKTLMDLAWPNLKSLIQEREKEVPDVGIPESEEDLAFWKLVNEDPEKDKDEKDFEVSSQSE
jgi:phospholipid-translocating P-type ATPase (flippase)